MTDWSEQAPLWGGGRFWLQAQGSLSARLAATGRVFDVQVLRQGRGPVTVDETCALGVEGQHEGYVREVVLRLDAEAMVFARSVTPCDDSLARWRSLRWLGTSPLADVLFTRADISRLPMQYTRLKPTGPTYRHVAHAWQEATEHTLTHQPLPARRSLFVRHAAPLLVLEVFAAPSSVWRGLAHSPRKHQGRQSITRGMIPTDS